jgi:hypothetical protein
VDFHGAQLLALGEDTPETTIVAMKPIVEGIGLDWEGQHKKLLSRPFFSQGISIMEIPSAGDIQRTTGLSLNRLSFWLATIQTNRIADLDIRARIIAYQTKCADVLHAHFFGRALAHPDQMSIDDRAAVGGIVKGVTAKPLGEIRANIAGIAGRANPPTARDGYGNVISPRPS